MELSDLVVFRAVVEEGGITKAAEKLHRVPSNVTARVQKLELELGKQLFLREKKRLRISPAGEILLGYADEILRLSTKAINELKDDVPRGVLSIGVMEAVAATRLPGPLARFHRAYPEVQLDVSTAPTGVLIDDVIDGRLNVAIVADPQKDDRLTIHPVFEETLVAITSDEVDDLSSLSGFGHNPCILVFSARCAYRKRLTQWLSRLGGAARVSEINSYHALMSCTTAGMGVGIVPESVINAFPQVTGIKIHSLPSDIAHSVSCAIWRTDSVKPSILAFYHSLHSE